MESIFDLEHMSAVFVSDDGQLENVLSMSDVFHIFRKCCYSSHAPTRLCFLSVSNMFKALREIVLK